MGENLTLQDVCKEIVDCVNRTAPEDPDGEFFAIGTPAMRGNKINLAEARRLSREVYDRWTRRLVPKGGDLLLAREAPVGPVVRIPDGGTYAAGQRTTHLRANPEMVDPRFLYYLLISPEVQQRILAGAMGSTVPHLRVADVKALPLPDLPNPKTQRGIAELLGALDDKISANDVVGEVSKNYLRAEFDALGMIPGWNAPEETRQLDDFVVFNPRTPITESAAAPYLEMKNLPDNAMTVSQWIYRSPKGGARFRNHDTLFARITPCLENGKTGFVDFLSDGTVGTGSTEFIVMRARDGVPVAFPYFVATDDEFRAFAMRHMVGTSGRQRVAADDLAKFEIRPPSTAGLDRFGQIADPLLATIRGLVEESRRLTRTRDQLLPLLMSGKVTVKDIEPDIEDII